MGRNKLGGFLSGVGNALARGAARGVANAVRQAKAQQKREIREAEKRLREATRYENSQNRARLREESDVLRSAQRLAESVNKSLDSSKKAPNPKTKIKKILIAKDKLAEINKLKLQYPYLKIYEMEQVESRIKKILADAENELQDQEMRDKKNKLAGMTKIQQKEKTQQYKMEMKQKGIDRSAQAQKAIEELNHILKHALNIKNAIDWSKHKDKTMFTELPPELKLPAYPKEKPLPEEETPKIVPKKPDATLKPDPPARTTVKYQPVFVILDNIFTSHKSRKIAEAEALFQQDYAEYVNECKRLDVIDADKLKKWEIQKSNIEAYNATIRPDWERAVESMKTEYNDKKIFWEEKCKEIRAKHDIKMEKWSQRKDNFYESQEKINTAIDIKRKKYTSREKDAVTDYCASVLSNSNYPDYFPKGYDLDYSTDTRILVVEYSLPAPEAMPTLKDVQYVQSKDDFKETHLSEKDREVMYDGLLYQIALRTIYELFDADKAKAIDAVTFNGMVSALDKTTGHKVTSCVLSVLARKEPFMKIKFVDIEPKACFKSLKGVSASKMTGLTAISPVMILDKTDRRFVDAYGVTDNINQGTNLATMDWEDFEHLIRELFELEFASGGGEVKVTQASRDGGVDAVAFDPDPIRGGKIVIQAKRYTNTVGVSAVRDLFGTVMNEGAIKGLLVTTADYGPDAYEFAKDKPLTLLNGSNLLHLLEKHGHRARINLNEARQENKLALSAGINRKRKTPLKEL